MVLYKKPRGPSPTHPGQQHRVAPLLRTNSVTTTTNSNISLHPTRPRPADMPLSRTCWSKCRVRWIRTGWHWIQPARPPCCSNCTLDLTTLLQLSKIRRILSASSARRDYDAICAHIAINNHTSLTCCEAPVHACGHDEGQHTQQTKKIVSLSQCPSCCNEKKKSL